MRKTMGMGAAAAVLLCASAGSADSLEFTLDTKYSGHQAAGTVHVKFTSYTAGSGYEAVRLTITNDLQGGEQGEFIDGTGAGTQGGIFFNFTDALDVSALSITEHSRSGTFGNWYKYHAGGATTYGLGGFDIRFDFDFAPPTVRFGETDSITFDIALAGTDIYAADFNHLSATSIDGYGPFLAAAHIQGLAGGKSGWHSPTLVPLPTPVYLGFAGLGLAAGVSVIKRRR